MEGFININLQKVAEHPDFSPFLGTVARWIQESPYRTLSQFFHWITDADLAALLDMTETCHRNLNHLDELLLMAEILAVAEGLPSEGDEQARDNLAYFITAISIVALNRKGLVGVDYTKMTFGRDYDGQKMCWILNRPE